MGKCAYKFVDFLKAAGQKYWQFLPLYHVSYGTAPISPSPPSPETPYYIDLDLLIKDGLPRAASLRASTGAATRSMWTMAASSKNRYRVLRLAYERGAKKLSAELESFRRENGWLENYALYMSLKSHSRHAQLDRVAGGGYPSAQA